jgi:DNA-binding NarL/FixJ family response regulator
MDGLHPLRMKALPPPAVKLTPRESEIIEAILGAASNKAIALRLGISEQSVKNRLTSLYKKIGVGNRLELVLVLMKPSGESQFPIFSPGTVP